MRYHIFALFCCLSALAVTPTYGSPLFALPETPELSPAGYSLIVEYEVGGGESYYDRFLRRPEWPRGASGITVGVGYDCGYNSRANILEDWRATGEAGRLARASGITGSRARALLASLRDIEIAWPLANDVFLRVDVARNLALCRRAYPGFDALRPNAQASLVSLTFNRGAGMVGPTRREMRAIRNLCPTADYSAMALEERLMKRVWLGTADYRGLAARCEAQARLMETP